jgi:hypothetical protein
MTDAQCNARARECAANAALARVESISQEFLKLAALWRAMAIRDRDLGRLGEAGCRLATAPIQARLRRV